MLLHIYDAEDDDICESAWARSDDPPREKHGIVSGTQDPLGDCLNALVAAGKVFDAVLVETHGASGVISIGGLGYNLDWFIAVVGRYGYLVAPNARIYFNGCNVADDPDGWAFLEAVAGAFIGPWSGGPIGGQVFAQTSLGFANPFSGHVVHLWGSTRTVNVDSSGNITHTES
jgi:hypothetical protein